MTGPERIVIAIDEGEACQAAVDWVVKRVGSRRAQLTLVTAIDELMIDRGQDERLEHTRARIATRIPEASIDLVSAEGPLTQVLQEHAGTADILVVGNRRTRAIRSILAGASALRIAATSSVPTVLVSDDTSGGQGAVVLGVAADGSSEGARAFAVEEAKRSGTALEIVHAWGPPAASETLGFPDRPAEVVAEHRIVLETAAHQIRSDWPELDVRDYLVGDEPADALVARAARASLVVIGTRGLDPVTGIIRDSIGHAVSARSRTPLCIVPAPWRPR